MNVKELVLVTVTETAPLVIEEVSDELAMVIESPVVNVWLGAKQVAVVVERVQYILVNAGVHVLILDIARLSPITSTISIVVWLLTIRKAI